MTGHAVTFEVEARPKSRQRRAHGACAAQPRREEDDDA